MIDWQASRANPAYTDINLQSHVDFGEWLVGNSVQMGAAIAQFDTSSLFGPNVAGLDI